MAQHDYNIANQSFPSFRTDLNNALSAIQTCNSGTSRPTGAVAGQIWLDTTSATSPTLKIYDGADDISLATINYTSNTVDWLDSSVTITGLSTTATGTVVTLSDSSLTSSVNLILQNQKEIRFSETTANGVNYVGFKAPASLSADKIWVLPSADGTAGQFLKTDGAGNLSFGGLNAGSVGIAEHSATGTPSSTTFLRGDNTWASAGATAGQVIQVVTATDSVERATTSTSYVGVSQLSASITPSSTSNKILILVSSGIHTYAPNGAHWTVYRGATNLATGTSKNAFAFLRYVPSGGGYNSVLSIAYLDSPSTTSSTTYQVYQKTDTTSAYINIENTTGSITLMEIKG